MHKLIAHRVGHIPQQKNSHCISLPAIYLFPKCQQIAIPHVSPLSLGLNNANPQPSFPTPECTSPLPHANPFWKWRSLRPSKLLNQLPDPPPPPQRLHQVSISDSMALKSPPYHSGGISSAARHTTAASIVSIRVSHGSKLSHPLTCAYTRFRGYTPRSGTSSNRHSPA
jgi:hypothetical protein